MKTMTPGDYTFTVVVDSSERFYIAHVPPGYDGRAPVPVGMMLHGGGGTAKGMMAYTGWSRKADEKTFIAVYPEATRPDLSQPASWQNSPTWNDGSLRFEAGGKAFAASAVVLPTRVASMAASTEFFTLLYHSFSCFVGSLPTTKVRYPQEGYPMYLVPHRGTWKTSPYSIRLSR